jgi:hypothetical protein
MARKRKDPEVGKDVKSKYLVGGVWKRHIIEKKDKGRSERTKLGRVYIAIPPPEGWPGGLPEKNGYKAGGK